mmetsp:Transcript_73550/g.175252  ORF Transcript_73550/g.175252 Transcript_73550/m.175252 type:complete len:382 (+) Transcript_73550:113-1258(+)
MIGKGGMAAQQPQHLVFGKGGWGPANPTPAMNPAQMWAEMAEMAQNMGFNMGMGMNMGNNPMAAMAGMGMPMGGCFGGKSRGYAECSVHGKMRSTTALKDDGNGGMACIPGQECKVAALKRGADDDGEVDGSGKRMKTDGTQALCIIHQKVRHIDNLSEDGNGGYYCIPGKECQLSGSTEGNTTCSLHGKVRSISSLVDDGNGGYRCAPGNTCKVSGQGGFGFGCGGFGMKMRGPAEGTVMCSLHNVSRTMRNLEEDGSGGYVCKVGCECKVASGATNDGPGGTCSVHGKQRSASSLIDDGAGGMRCAPGMECKAGKGDMTGMMSMMQQMWGGGASGPGMQGPPKNENAVPMQGPPKSAGMQGPGGGGGATPPPMQGPPGR